MPSMYVFRLTLNFVKIEKMDFSPLFKANKL